MYVYFSHFPNKHMEHGIKVVEFLQTKCLKIFCNIKTQWFMVAPTKCVLAKYKSLVVMMNDDLAENVITT
jgi:hypothetical protein